MPLEGPPRSLAGKLRTEPENLSPKEFLTRENRMHLSRLIIAGMVCGFAVCVLGVILVAVADTDSADSSISLLRVIDVTTGSIGVACLALGAIIIIFSIREFMRKWH